MATRWLAGIAIIGLMLALPELTSAQSNEVAASKTAKKPERVLRDAIKIDDKTPLAELLPIYPAAQVNVGPLLGDDLGKVPEIALHEPLMPDLPLNESSHVKAANHLTSTMAKIDHLNQKDPDGFMTALLAHRADLAGLPVLKGDAARMKGGRAQAFHAANGVLRGSMHMAQRPIGYGSYGGSGFDIGTFGIASAQFGNLGGFQSSAKGAIVQSFWKNYPIEAARGDKAQLEGKKAAAAEIVSARVAVLLQVLGVEPADVRVGLAKHLGGVDHADATRALAKLAIYSAEEEVRQAAVEALKARRAQDYTATLIDGLRYPYAPVARRSAEAIARLERKDLLPTLIDMLDEPDPRAPVAKEVNGKKEFMVRELVRINHHRNCFLCHAPGRIGEKKDPLLALVHIPGKALPMYATGNQNGAPEIVVRIDITHLRQDFSAMLTLPEEAPWPDLQRFDFVVRNRVLSEAEAAKFSAALKAGAPEQVNPYQRAIIATLVELADSPRRGEACRRFLGLEKVEP